MELTFYVAGAVAVVATALMLTRADVVHALLDLVVSLLAVAVAFAALGAPFVAALEVIVYAGAIMVLFLFAVMMLGAPGIERASARAGARVLGWAGPAVLAALLLSEFLAVLLAGGPRGSGPSPVPPAAVGLSLFSTYVLGVELVAAILLAALLGAYH